MNRRIFKKLCKKASKIFNDDWVVGDDDDHGIIGVWYKASYEYDEWDFVTAWEILSMQFGYAHMEYDDNNDGWEWVGPKRTTINKLKWARQITNNQLERVG